MREILFRGKCLDNGEWVYGYLIREPSGKSFIGTYAPIGSYWDWVEVEPETVGQYTGMLDEEENKIWEGDILTDAFKENYVMRYADVDGRFYGKRLGCLVDTKFEWFHGAMVLGNCFDNPELSEEQT